MKKFSQILTVIMSLGLGACAFLAPSYQRPQVDAPTRTKSGLPIESSNEDYSKLEWWKKMDDPVLNQLITQALANNNQIQMAQGNIMQAQAQLKAAQYSWLPTLSAMGGGFTGNAWGTNFTPEGGSSTSMANTNFSGYYGGFVPNYTLNIFANINQTRLAHASLDMKNAAMSATRLSVIGQVSGAYFMLLGQKKQLQLQQEMVSDLQKLAELQKVQIQAGASDASMLAILQQQITTNQAKLPQIEDSIAQTENALQVLLSKNPATVATRNDIDNLNLESMVPANLPSTILKNRPDIMMAEDNLRMANANIGLADSMFFPTISLTGLAGGASTALSGLFSVTSGFWAGQAAAAMPILNAASYEQVKAAKGGYYVAYYDYMQTVQTAFANVDNTLTNQQKMNQAYAVTVQAKNSAQKYYTITIAKFNAGAKDRRDVIGAKLDVDMANIQLNQAKMQQLDSIVQVYQALAGGYNAESNLSAPRKIS
ncbi:MAG TPA: efflux transporter outer membrane subunit [Burkholderiales bacterium]|nr:efflux transporter outer membrane subunit [Burkholderiales bacterium]